MVIHLFKKVSIRWRFTLLTACLLTICCVGLTIVLNQSAFTLADTIEATTLLPAMDSYTNIQGSELPSDALPINPVNELQEAKQSFRSQSFLYMLFVIVTGSALTYYLSGKALKPLETLNAQVKNINVHNLANVLAVPSTKDEIAELTENFNEMTKKLDEVFMSQKRFSANAAHELRTPLAVLQTKVDVFKKRERHSDMEYQALIVVFEKQIGRLRNLIEHLLDMATMDEETQYNMLSLSDIFEDICAELTGIANDKQITLTLQCDDSTLLGNVDLLYRSFYNLVENGIKYNTSGGSVHIDVKQKANHQVQIQISDTGIGIPDRMKKKIFEPFYRVEASRSREMGGAGLGLSIVHSIIKKHGGTIDVFDNTPKGSCFLILL